MHATKRVLLVASVLFALPLAPPARADLFTFSTGIPDARLGTASGGSGALEAESADDFITTAPTSLTGGSFFGMLPSGTSLSDVAVMTVEIYRVFPLDSVVGATSGPPNFATSRVPTRVNSPSDFDFDDRSTATGDLTFQCTVLSTSFTVANTVLGTGIHPIPGETTGGDGPGSGEEVRCDVTFTTPFLLPPEHYFFVPQVTLTNGAPFLWLSAARPIVPPGTP